MLDVRRMKVLREVAEQGSFSAAAEALNFTQSAISQHVAALERETGARLVERGPRGVRLTDAGSALVAHTEAILTRLDAAEEELAAIAGLRGGRLRLASFQSAGATLIPQAVAVFAGRHPQVELGMIEAEPEQACELLRSGEIDMALVYGHDSMPPSFAADCELTPLVEDTYDAILASGHPLVKKRKLSLADLAEEPWISSSWANGCRHITDEVCRQAGFEPRVAFEADETMASQALVAAGVGVALLPRLALTSLHPGVVARSLTDKPRRQIHAVRLDSAYRSPACEAMLQILRDVAGEFGETSLELAAS